MKINRHSIFLKLNLLFLIAVFSISVVFFIFMKIGEKRHLSIIMSDSRQVMRMIRTVNKIDPVMLKEEGYQIIKDKKSILEKATPVKYPKNLPPRIKKRLQTKKLQILKLHSDVYFYINLPKHQLLIKNRSYPNTFVWILLSYLAVISILLFIYLALKHALTPIKKLEEEIKKFGDGAVDVNTKSDKKDEIAAVGNQFYNAVQKIKTLQNTRTLFLRNMMHELKTPITKGKLSLALMKKSPETLMLGKVFNSLDSLINEMADIEHITTQNVKIGKKKHLLIDIIDHAKELLYLENEQLIHKIADQSISCDFKLFGIAVKNLIDNGIKYSSDQKVEIKADAQSIQFINNASALKYDFEHYLEPFYKGALTEVNQKGFGLGLYIVNEIVKIHGFSLEYKHQNGKNIFTIIESSQKTAPYNF